jgi:uncharacterized protein YgiM (DUF1202 family)
MKKLMVLLTICTLLLCVIPASAGVMIVSSTPTYDDSEAMEQNLDLAIEWLNGKIVAKGQTFSFNETIGARTPENSFVLAPNGNGISVMGGGVSQVATTLNMALKELGNDIVIDEQHTFGGAYSAGYVEDVKDTVLTDYERGLDFRFTSNHAENLSISMWRAGNMVFCQLTGIGTATTAPDATPEPESTDLPTSAPERPARETQTMYVANVNSFVNLRDEPSTGAKSLAQVPKGEAVHLTGERSGDFLQVIYDGKTGYVHGAYLSLENPNLTMLTVINCQTNVSLWAEPSTRADKLTAIPLGAKVEYFNTTEDGFRKVGYEGMTGYVIVAYLTEPAQ